MLIVTNDRRFGGVSSRKELNTDDEDGKEIGLPGGDVCICIKCPPCSGYKDSPSAYFSGK